MVDAPPYDEDFFQRIVNVQWGGGGGVFVSGDAWGVARYVRVKHLKDTQDWTGQTLEFTQGAGGEIHGSSYAAVGQNKKQGVKGAPVFVFGGLGYPEPVTNENQAYGIFWASSDGTNWSITLDISEPSTIIGVDGIVWDAAEEAFFADVGFDNRESGEFRRECYQSATGFGWGPGGGDFQSHCNGKLPGQPDGYYGYDETKDILIKPADGLFGVAVKVKGQPERIVTAGLEDVAVSCVAFAGGIWEAGGYTGSVSCTATSIDDGMTWTIVSTGALGLHDDTGLSPEVVTMIGAPISDLNG